MKINKRDGNWILCLQLIEMLLTTISEELDIKAKVVSGYTLRRVNRLNKVIANMNKWLTKLNQELATKISYVIPEKKLFFYGDLMILIAEILNQDNPEKVYKALSYLKYNVGEPDEPRKILKEGVDIDPCL